MDDTTLSLAAKSGCIKLWFGLEATSERLLSAMRKGITFRQASEVLERCFRYGIAVHVFTMLGFPTETEEEARDLMEFLRRNACKLSTVSLSAFHLHVLSDVAVNPSRYGVRKRRRHTRVDVPLLLEYEEETRHDYVRQFQREFFSSDAGSRLGGGNEISKSHLLLLCGHGRGEACASAPGTSDSSLRPPDVRWVRLRFWSDLVSKSIGTWMGVSDPLGRYGRQPGFRASRSDVMRLYGVNAVDGRGFVLSGAAAEELEAAAKEGPLTSAVTQGACTDILRRLKLVPPAGGQRRQQPREGVRQS
jgi:hypothetical protein